MLTTLRNINIQFKIYISKHCEYTPVAVSLLYNTIDTP